MVHLTREIAALALLQNIFEFLKFECGLLPLEETTVVLCAWPHNARLGLGFSKGREYGPR